MIADTIESIVSQSIFDDGTVVLDYVVQDGASTDQTVEVAKKALAGRGIIRSEPDAGMYDALSKAWVSQTERADIYFYLNAGDVLQPRALALVVETMRRTHCHWLMGLQTHYSAQGPIISTNIPFRYKRDWIQSGVYGRRLPHIQQESQFWSGTLMSSVDLHRLSEFRLAGDYFLWASFARQCSPTVIQAALSGFKLHGGHLGEDVNRYWNELTPYLSRTRVRDVLPICLEQVLWKVPWRLKRGSAPSTLWYIRDEQLWRQT